MPEVPNENGDPRIPETPLVLVPVSADDVARQKRRIKIAIWSAAILVLGIAGWIYKHSVDPLHAQQSYDDGVRLLKIARYDQAILAFGRAASLKPDLTDVYIMRGRAYMGLSKTEEAIRDFTTVVEQRPADAVAFVERGLAYMEMKDYRSALTDADHAIGIDANLARAYNLRGLAMRSMGDLDKSLESFTRAVNLLPNADDYYQRGATYQLLGRYRDAIADFDKVIAFKPDEAPAYFARAESRRAIGDLAGAKADHLQGRIIDGR